MARTDPVRREDGFFLLRSPLGRTAMGISNSTVSVAAFASASRLLPCNCAAPCFPLAGGLGRARAAVPRGNSGGMLTAAVFSWSFRFNLLRSGTRAAALVAVVQQAVHGAPRGEARDTAYSDGVRCSPACLCLGHAIPLRKGRTACCEPFCVFF